MRVVYSPRMADEQVQAAVGKALRAVREATGLSQQDTAEWLDTTQATVSRWEGGKTTPSANTLHTLATLYRTTPGAFYSADVQRATADLLKARAQSLAAGINARHFPKEPHGD